MDGQPGDRRELGVPEGRESSGEVHVVTVSLDMGRDRYSVEELDEAGVGCGRDKADSEPAQTGEKAWEGRAEWPQTRFERLVGVFYQLSDSSAIASP